MTILTAIQGVCAQLTLDIPSAVFSSTDIDIMTIRTIANTEVSTIVRRHDWQALRKEQHFTTSATETQTGAIPDDYLRIVNGSMNNRTLNRPVWGPLTPQWWQKEKALPIYTSPNYAFTQRGNQFLFSPVPQVGNDIYYEYITKNAVYDSLGVGKQYFTADDDEFALDEQIIELGCIWRFKAIKGLDYSQEQQNYEVLVSNLFAQEQPANTIALDGRSPRYRLGMPTIKEGSWP